jgi:hypothetical protein
VTPNEALSRTNLKTPKAAAIAGMLFSLLTVAAFWLLWISVPADPQEPGSWLNANSSTVALGLNLIPFAGIAFLWFIGVLRDRLGQLEDRFFATVFFGSGLLFLGVCRGRTVKIGGAIEGGVACLNERCRGGLGTIENNEQHCGAVALVSSS